jgi:predicted transcriptional regulator
MSKRTKLEIIRDLLLAIKENKSIKITRLIYKSNLTHKSIKPYINNLVINKMVEEKSDRKNSKFYTLTGKGEEFLQEFIKMKVLSESFGLS